MTWTVNYEYSAMALATYWGVMSSFIADDKVNKNAETGHVIDAGKSYVLYATVKNAAPDVLASAPFAVRFGLTNEIATENITGSDWVEVKKVIKATEDADCITMGFNTMTATTKDSAITLNLKGDAAPYLAEEVAYDIKNEIISRSNDSEGNVVLMVKSEILNQIGITGNLDQNVTWYAFNADRSALVKDIVIAEIEEGVATVTIPASCAKQEYNIMAFSDSYNLRKAVKVESGEMKVSVESITDGVAKVLFDIVDGTSNDIIVYIANYLGTTLASEVVAQPYIITKDGTKEIPYTVEEGTNTRVFVWDKDMKPILK